MLLDTARLGCGTEHKALPDYLDGLAVLGFDLFETHGPVETPGSEIVRVDGKTYRIAHRKLLTVGLSSLPILPAEKERLLLNLSPYMWRNRLLLVFSVSAPRAGSTKCSYAR